MPRGQGEAAGALGLSKGQQMRLVALPQALRVIIPPMTNQYLNLTKNSSLAVAIGYPDVVSIANTAINQTGRAVECIAIIMLVYLTHLAGHLGADELVQQARGDQGTLSMDRRHTFQPIAPRAGAGRAPRALVPWIKRNLFGNLPSSLATLIVARRWPSGGCRSCSSWGLLEGGVRARLRRMPGGARHRRLLGRGDREVPPDHLRPLPLRAAVAAR